MTIHYELMKEMAKTINRLAEQRDTFKGQLNEADEEIAILRNELALMRIDRDQYKQAWSEVYRKLTEARQELSKLKNDDKS